MDRRELEYLPGYAVDEEGGVWCNRPINGKMGPVTEWRPVKALLCSKGRYLQVGAFKKKHLIHRLVASAFIGDCPNGFEVSHKNGDGKDNRAINLEYLDHVANEQQKKEHGTAPKGQKNSAAKLTDREVAEIKAELKNSKRGTARILSIKYGVSESIISGIKHGKRWI